jgi:hypothetical protein
MEMPTTIIAMPEKNILVFGLCEEHYQQGNKPGVEVKLSLEFNSFDAFKFKTEMDAIEKDMLESTPEEVDQYLRDAGYDPDALVERMRKRMRKALDESPLNPNNQITS